MIMMIYIYYDDNDTIDTNDTIFCFYTLQALSLDFFIVLDKDLACLGLQTFSLYPSTQDSYFLIFIKILFNVDYSNYANVEHWVYCIMIVFLTEFFSNLLITAIPTQWLISSVPLINSS